jgi:penicillin-binding protein 2B
VELPAEAAGLVNIRYASEVATSAFGQGLAVTPMQMVAAVSAVANGGKLMTPQIVKQTEDPVSGEIELSTPSVVRQVVSPQAARKTGEYLEQVVIGDNGSGYEARIDGYRIAGKTGTAQKVVDGKYSPNDYVYSFTGYAPVEDPRVVIYVLIDDPDTPLGAAPAAPVFREIMGQTLRHLNVPMYASANVEYNLSEQSGEVSLKVPSLSGTLVPAAEDELQAAALTYEIIGEGSTVLSQIPAAGSYMPAKQKIYLITEQPGDITVPDLTGLSLRDALEAANVLGIKVTTEGSGYVTGQTEDTEGAVRTLHLILAAQTSTAPVPPLILGGTDATDTAEEQAAPPLDPDPPGGQTTMLN